MHGPIRTLSLPRRGRALTAGVLGLLLAGCAGGTRPAATPTVTTAPITGIGACDAYLDSYLRCHRAATTFPAEQLPAHYQAMRDSLLDASRDAQTRPLLDKRCMVLRQQISAAAGKSC